MSGEGQARPGSRESPAREQGEPGSGAGRARRISAVGRARPGPVPVRCKGVTGSGVVIGAVCFLNRPISSQLTINTAIVYMHRFYMVQSFTQFHRNVSVLGSGGVGGAGNPPQLCSCCCLAASLGGATRWDRPWGGGLEKGRVVCSCW